ncbi:helix-turn-helix domain-containing protein [Altericroceibacterium endophyticum]|uniref:Helix-turn-helix domain-containing protein n=1 Tax=Altericroceibacterium endophyticum TaxID=1808508 RepID=A0A6I4T7B8_9SPHN|nr:helix-turn-helix transcriptional regulator [Altericroceibacterium endophyticum]MXO66707.1 helix-turn-helix domain-containing protein [Altericroceibacterium endophyticum]
MPKTIFTGTNLVVVQTIKEARLQSGLKQTDLAAKVGKDQSWLSLIEGSQRRLDVVEFINLAEAMGLSPEDLFADVLSRLNPNRDKE